MPTPRTLLAGDREAGTICAQCGKRINYGDHASICQSCGGIHHEMCWQIGQGCAAYECRPASREVIAENEPLLKVTTEQLASAEPLAPRKSFAEENAAREVRPKRWSRASVAAFVIAVLGIPLFGLITGLFAIIIGCIALAGHSSHRRGFSLAVAGVLIGLFDVIGWGVGLGLYFGNPRGVAVSLDQLKIDPASLEDLPEKIARAMRANVLIETQSGLLQQGLGAGVILKIENNSALIVTNRHVVDLDYSDSTTGVPKDLSEMGSFTVMTVDQSTVPGKVEWIAPHGIDLAILRAPLLSNEPQEAYWNVADISHVSDNVFAIGNPHGLSWTHTAGDISRIARNTKDGFDYRVIQTSAAINPGNSGGGLYDAQGRLIGINSLTYDKRVADGLGFAIAISALLDLAPERLKLAPQNPEAEEE